MNFKRCFFFIGNMILISCLFAFLKYITALYLLGKVLNDTSGFLSLVPVYNTGAAFGIMQNSSRVLVLFAAVVIMYCIYYMFSHKFYISDNDSFILSMFCAGILGNAYERFFYGHVFDFIKINLFNFPVFNYHDILITFGATLIIIRFFLQKHDEKRQDKDVEEDQLYM